MAKRSLTDADGQQKFFNVPNPFHLELWLEHCNRLAEHGREMDKTADWLNTWGERFQWDVGDLLLEAEAGKVPMKKLEKIAAQRFPKHTWKTLRNWKVTARAIESSRRRDGREGRAWLKFSTQQVVEQYSPELQEKFLQLAVDQDLSRNELKQAIKKFFKGSLGERKQSWVPVTIKVSAKDHLVFEKWALARGIVLKRPPRKYDDGSGIYGGRPGARLPDVAGMIWWMAREYYKEHKAEFDALHPPPPKS